MGPGGTWYNELDSTMVLQVNSGALTGTYQSPKGAAPALQSLVGSIDPNPFDGSQVLGWVVRWVNVQKPIHAVTAWCGEYQIIDGDEFITTEWLLTSATDPDDDWASTLVGHDVFTRTKPQPDVVDLRSKLRAWSHPK
jgi:hypothetical protein